MKRASLAASSRGIFFWGSRGRTPPSRRLLSSSAAAAWVIGSDGDGELLPHDLPVRHSRRQLPPVCRDAAELRERTQEVLEGPVGALYAYAPSVPAGGGGGRRRARIIGRDREAAWDAADPTVQLAEYLIRGHAWSVEGTAWNRWTRETSGSSSSSSPPPEALLKMKQLIDRLRKEGEAYMQVRRDRMEELYGGAADEDEEEAEEEEEEEEEEEDFLLEQGEVKEAVVEKSDESFEDMEDFTIEGFDDDIARYARREEEARMHKHRPHGFMHLEEGEEEPEGLQQQGEDALEMLSELGGFREESAVASLEEETYLKDFAAPGPTVMMYDALADAMACQPANQLVTPDLAMELLTDVLKRHDQDGGDQRNTNVHTRPTQQSFNAMIRTAAALPYTGNDEPLRDGAITLAFGSWAEMSSCGIVERNSATYTYLLQTVAKYLPASVIRGNVAAGLWHHARFHGLVSDELIEAYRAANAPSNGALFDDFLAKTLLKPAAEMPKGWTRNSYKRRYHRSEIIY